MTIHGKDSRKYLTLQEVIENQTAAAMMALFDDEDKPITLQDLLELLREDAKSS